LAVDQADRFIKTGKTGEPEKQIIPCELVTRTNVDDFRDFEKIK
jgi:erythritol transport system substrate-binding protein